MTSALTFLAWGAVIGVLLTINHLVHRMERPRRQDQAEALADLTRETPGPEPQTLIVPPCGCINTFTRTDIIRCPRHAQRAAAAWADDMHRKTGL